MKATTLQKIETMNQTEQDFNEMSKHVDRVGGCVAWIVALISIILCICLLSSCNPFISKELRHKKRCNKKLERVVKKCPELLKPDTITVVIPEVKIDTVFKVDVDTLKTTEIVQALDTIVTFKERLKYLNKYVTETIYLDTNVLIDGYLIHVNLLQGELYVSLQKPEEKILIPDEVIKPIEYSFFEKVRMELSKFYWWLIIGLVIYIGIGMIKKKIKD